MRRALLALLLLASPASAQTIVQLPGVTYAPGALRVASSVASGCPLTSCVPTSLSVADDGALCVCDSGGAWVGAGSGDLTAHLSDTTDAHDASAISVLDSAMQLVATEVESALAEILDALQAHEADAADAHDASAISIIDMATQYTATDVEGALTEAIDAAQAAQGTADAAIPKATLAAANTLLVGTAASTPDDLVVAESQSPCRPAAGSLQSCDASTLRTMIGVAASGDTLLTSLATVADQILVSTGASAWSAVTVGASTLLGKGAAGAVDDLTPSQARTVLGIDPAAAGDVAVGTGAGTVGLVTIATNTVLGSDGAAVEALDATELLALIGVESGADVTDATNVDGAGAVMLADYNAHTLLAATTDDTPVALTVGEQTIVGRITGGAIAALSTTQIRTLINVEDGADVTDAATVGAAGALMSTTCAGANTIWGCTADDTAAILTPAQIRSAAGIAGKSASACPTIDAPDGTSNNVAVDQCFANGADVYTTMTGNAATQDRASCHWLSVEEWATAWDTSAGVTLRYKVSGSATLTMQVYDADDPIGTPCYASSAGTSGTFATITATSTNLASCTVPAGGVIKVCGFCATSSPDICYVSTATKDIE